VLLFARAVTLHQSFSAPGTAEFAAGTLYVSTVANAPLTLAHANKAQTDRTLGFVAMG
jgi:hypothetical protein